MVGRDTLRGGGAAADIYHYYAHIYSTECTVAPPHRRVTGAH